MKRIPIIFAGLALAAGTSFAVMDNTTTSSSTPTNMNMMNSSNYQIIQLETNSGVKVNAVISKEEADKLGSMTSGEQVKVWMQDSMNPSTMGTGTGTGTTVDQNSTMDQNSNTTTY